MENDYLLDTNMETISPPSSPKDQSPNSFSCDHFGRLGIINQGTETVINETQNSYTNKNVYVCTQNCVVTLTAILYCKYVRRRMKLK